MKNKGEITTTDLWNDIYRNRKLPIIPDTKSWLDYQIYTSIDKYFKKDKKKRFIEAGCAPGKYGVYFAKSFGYEVFGFDYSPSGVALTKTNWNILNVKGEVIEADVFDLPDRFQNFFDVVLSAGFIEHFSDPKKIVDILSLLLKKNGLIVTIVPNTYRCLNSILKKAFCYKEYLKIKETHIPIDMDNLLNYHSGFDILCAKRIIGFFPESIFSSSDVLSRIMKRIFRKALFLFMYVRLNKFLQYDFFASHFMIIGKKN